MILHGTIVGLYCPSSLLCRCLVLCKVPNADNVTAFLYMLYIFTFKKFSVQRFQVRCYIASPSISLFCLFFLYFTVLSNLQQISSRMYAREFLLDLDSLVIGNKALLYHVVWLKSSFINFLQLPNLCKSSGMELC